MNKESNIELQYNFKDKITTILGTKEYIVMSLQINMDKEVTYGCADESGDWKWFRSYEIKKPPKPRKIGITLRSPDDDKH